MKICVIIIHKSTFITEDSDEEEAPRRKRQRAEKAAAGELGDEEVSGLPEAWVEPFVMSHYFVETLVVKSSIYITVNINHAAHDLETDELFWVSS